MPARTLTIFACLAVLSLLALTLTTGCDVPADPGSQSADQAQPASPAATAQADPQTASTDDDAPLMATPPGRVEDERRLIDRPDEIVTVLGNGMTVIAKRYAAAPVATVRMHVKAGSIYEDNYVGSGISHLFEHLLHGGTTERRSEEESIRILDRIGAQTNAYTYFDETVYYIDVPAARTGEAIDLLADWVTRPKFPPAEVRRELGVVQRELERNLDNPGRQLWLRFNALRYQVHPARFPVIGEQSAVARLTRDDILAYYKRMYVPSRVCFTVVGDIDPEETLTEVKKQFADFTARADQPIALPAEPPVTSPRSVVYPMDVANVKFIIGFPTIPLLNDDLYPLDVMMYVLAGGQSSRLTVELRDQRKLALSVDAHSWTPSWAAGTFYISGECETAKWPELREAILEQFTRLREKPVSEEELAQSKRVAAVQYIRYNQTAGDIGESLASNQLSLGDAHFNDLYMSRLKQVTAAQMQDAARRYFDTGKLVTVLVTPRDFHEKVKSAGPESGVKTIEVSDVRKVRLDNGLTVLLRRNTAVPLVSIQMHFRGGLLGEPEGKAGLSSLFTSTALRGTKTRSAEEIFRAFESAGGTLGANSGRNSFSFSASVLSDSLDKMMPLFADVVLNPAFPEAEVDRFRQLTLRGIASIDEDLGSDAMRFFLGRFFGNYPYGHLPVGTADSVKALTVADLQAFQKRYVVGDNAVLAVFGDIDLDAAEALVRAQFAGMPMKPGFQMPERPAFTGSKMDSFAIHTSKLTEVAQVDIGYPSVPYGHPDYYALTMLDTMISGYGLPGGWLHEELRGRGLVYEVHTVNLSWLGAGTFWTYAKCQPAKVNEVRKVMNEQFARARRGELTEEMLVNAKATYLAAQLLDNQTNDQMAMRCALDEALGLGYDHQLKLSDRINAITLADVNRVARQYLTHSVTTITTGRPQEVEVPTTVPPVPAAPSAGKED